MFRSLLQLLLFVSVSFAAPQGGGGSTSHPHAGDLQRLYERVLKPNYQKIAPLREYARERQRSYYLSAALALIVFVLFVKYFKLMGAVVALLMIAGGIWYLKTQTPAISPYKAKFAEMILSPIAAECCGYRYHPGTVTEAQIAESRLFAPSIKHFIAHEGLWVKEGVRFGYVEIVFETKENASVERFAENRFEGFVVTIDRTHPKNGVLVSEPFKENVADIDPTFSAFFSPLPRQGEKGGFALFGEVDDMLVDRCESLRDKPIAVALTPTKTWIFYLQSHDPLDPSLYTTLDLHAVKGYAKAFETIDALVKACR